MEKLRNTLYSVQKKEYNWIQMEKQNLGLKAMEFEKNNETDLGHETRSSLEYD